MLFFCLPRRWGCHLWPGPFHTIWLRSCDWNTNMDPYSRLEVPCRTELRGSLSWGQEPVNCRYPKPRPKPFPVPFAGSLQTWSIGRDGSLGNYRTRAEEFKINNRHHAQGESPTLLSSPQTHCQHPQPAVFSSLKTPSLTDEPRHLHVLFTSEEKI